ncbi:MAG: hypothetical protein IJJ29_10005, partial [Solobacterium sp.]|nr:hypothetical protein [Solobacterium sp.]
MQYTTIADTGIRVSRICIGGMSFGVVTPNSHQWLPKVVQYWSRAGRQMPTLPAGSALTATVPNARTAASPMPAIA